MRREDWFQRALYLVIAVLGGYLIYKSAGILAGTTAGSSALDSGSVQRSLEDAAMSTYAPGYTASVENRDGSNWMAGWMRQIVPVYSYLAEGQAGAEQSVSGAAESGSGMAESGSGSAEDAAEMTGSAAGSAENAAGMTGDAVGSAENAAGTAEDALRSAEGSGQGAGESNLVASESGSAETGTAAEDNPGGSEIVEEISEIPEEDDPSGNGAAEGTAAEDDPGGNEIVEEISEVPEAESDGSGAAEDDSSGSGAAEDGSYEDAAVQAASSAGISSSLRSQLADFDYLLSHYYTVDGGTTADEELLDAEALLGTDLRLAQDPSVPQVLIYHTHSQEAFADSAEGDTGGTIVGMGEVLAQSLRGYGYNVIHDTGVYDLVDGVLDRSAAYDYARAAVEQILQEHPTIEVIIDLHRDGVEGQKFVTDIGGKPASMIMFFNGISRDSQDQPLYWLQNPYIQQNLAFSLQLQLKAEEKYPGFTRNIYLKAERFNLHLRPRSLLIEAGTQLNTVEEERNAMAPLADLIHQVLAGI